MLKPILTSALVSLALAGTAFAASPSLDPQLAGSAGVAPGEYSAAELQNIIDAKRANDTAQANFFISGTNRSSANASQSTANAQLALTAGVEPGRYTQAELVQIIDAKRENDTIRLNFYLSGANRAEASSGINGGKAQLAAGLGVNPADYSLSELAAMHAARVNE